MFSLLLPTMSAPFEKISKHTKAVEAILKNRGWPRTAVTDQLVQLNGQTVTVGIVAVPLGQYW
jgi:hypothetical protein